MPLLLTQTGEEEKQKAAREASDQKLGCNALHQPGLFSSSTAMPKGVITVKSEEQFEQAVAADVVSVVLFGAPWCGACKDLRAPYLKLSNAKPAASFHFYKVNVDQLTDVADKWKIDSMPTVMLFRKGTPVGKQLVAPKADEIKNACEAALGPPAPLSV